MLMAMTHRLAAEVEEATAEHEGWIIYAESGESWGWSGSETRSAKVRIELAWGDDTEMARALSVLVAVATKDGVA